MFSLIHLVFVSVLAFVVCVCVHVFHVCVFLYSVNPCWWACQAMFPPKCLISSDRHAGGRGQRAVWQFTSVKDSDTHTCYAHV